MIYFAKALHNIIEAIQNLNIIYNESSLDQVLLCVCMYLNIIYPNIIDKL